MGGGISLYHIIVASKTGLVGAIGVFGTSFLPNAYVNWKSNLTFTFFTTFVGDIIIVPTHYGPVWMEALCTGMLASGFAALTIYIRHFVKTRRIV
jgi:hypothetical protein